jgi:hypothetical protein
MKELFRTNDIVLISFIESLFNEENINYLVVDQHMSIVEGSLGAIPRRVLVDTTQLARAKRIITDAGTAHELAESTHEQ